MTRTGFGMGLRARARLPLLCVIALAILAIAIPATLVAAASDVWKAKVGTGGANGTATITAPATGAGTLRLALKALTASSAYAVKIVKGTCATPSTSLYSAGAQASTSTGKIAKSIAVPAAKMTAIRTAAAAGPIAIRVGAGSKLRCGPFTFVPAPSPTPEPSLAVRVGPTTSVGEGLADITSDASTIWTVDVVDSKAYRLDPTSGTASTTVDYSGGWLNLTLGCAVGEGSLWIAATDLFQNGGTVVRIKQGTSTVDQRMYVPGFAIAVTAVPGSVWVAADMPSALLRIDPAKNQVVQSISLPEAPSGVAVGGGSAWVSGQKSLMRVDLSSFAVTKIDLGSDVHDVAFGDGSVWATVDKTGSASAKLVRLDPATGSVVASIDIAGSPWDVSIGSGVAWVAPNDDANPYAVAVSTASNRVVASVKLSQGLPSVTVRGKSAWFAGSLTSGDTLLGGIVTRVDW
jgi:glutamine cyclotransferase